MTEEKSSTNKIIGIIAALIMMVGMFVLAYVLITSSNAGRKTILEYINKIKEGEPVSEQIAGAEAEALTTAIRRSSGFSISNFQSQSNTSCFWIALQGEGATSAQFVLAEGSNGDTVTAASLTRECDCPIDFDQPCHLK
jgi:hypothetical protein